VGLEGERGKLDPEGRRLGMDPVRPPRGQGADVLPRLVGQGLHDPARIRQDELGHAAQLESQSGVQHVAGGQTVVDPAPGGPGRGGEHVDEGGRVVVGDALALLDRLDGERGGPDRVELLLGRAVELLARRDLDLAHGLEVGVVGPDLGELGTRVARDHQRRDYATLPADR
jgi:hypothetical protein